MCLFVNCLFFFFFFFSSRRRHTRFDCDWSSDVCSSDLVLRVGADPSYLYVALAGRPSFDSARYVVGIDTYRRDRGQFRLPGVPGPTGAVGSEFALVLNDTSDAQLMVAPWYNPFLGPRSGMGSTGLDRFYTEAAGVDKVRSDGAFDSLFVTTNRCRIARTGRTYPARGVNRGRPRHRPSAWSAPARADGGR